MTGLVAVSLFCLFPPAAFSGPETVDRIDRFVEAGLQDNGVPGASMAIVNPDQTVDVRVFGHTGRGDDPVEARTPFIICSVTKSFTALAVMQLAERGRVALDAPVKRYLPWFEVGPPGEEPTVRNLLNQTSGLSSLAGGHEMRYLSNASILDTARSLAGEELQSTPGEEFEYANGNYVLLGALVEELSGVSYQAFVQRNILNPLGMSDTYLDLEQAEANGVSRGHRYWFGLTRPHTSYTTGLIPAGGIISTAPDMARYLRMVIGKGRLGDRRIISAESVALLTKPGPSAEVGPWAKDPDVNYGMGWYVGGGPFGPDPAIFHPGGSPDFGAMAAVLPESDQGIVLLYNVTPEVDLPGAAGDVDRVAAGAVSILMGSEPATGWSMHDFYLAFDLIVVALIGLAALQLWRASAKPLRKPSSPVRKVLRGLHIGLLIGLALMFLALPLAGPGWDVLFLALPDLALVLVILGLLVLGACVTLIVRSARATRRSEP